jgi:protease-4
MLEKIALVPIHGTIARAPSFIGSGVSVAQLLDILNKIKDKRSIKAIIFDIDSPGGEPYPSKELASAVKKIEKPTIANIKGYAASGAYWIASSCDKIVADELSIVGGIGVMGMRPDLSDFLQKIGININSIASGKFKEIGFPFKKPEEREKKIIKEQVKLIYDSFFRNVKENRKLNEKMLPDIKEGKTFYGKEALEAGLIDAIGDRETCIKLAKELANLKKSKVIDYSDKLRPSLFKSLFGR